jgi:hypothetical protein
MTVRRTAFVVACVAAMGSVAACGTILDLGDEPDPNPVRDSAASAEAGEPSSDASTVDVVDASPALRKRVFVTSAAWLAQEISGVIDSGTCQALANAQNLDGKFEPWLSYADTSPLTRIGDGPWYDVDRTTFIASKAALTDKTSEGGAPIVKCEDGGFLPPQNQYVWTGTLGDGTPGATCGDWSGSAPANGAIAGQTGSRAEAWTYVSAAPCQDVNHVYCFEK